MARVFLTIILPLLLPTLLYATWVMWTRRATGRSAVPPLDSLPWLWLATAGIVLTAGMLTLISLRVGSSGEGVYVPPRVINGTIVPGHLEPAVPAPR